MVRQSYQRGLQKDVTPVPVTVPAVSRSTADRWRCLFRGEVGASGWIDLPGYLIGSLGPPPLPKVEVRVGRRTWAAEIDSDGVELAGAPTGEWDMATRIVT